MIASPVVLAGIVVAMAAVFSFLNGAKDGANALATIITSRALAPRTATVIVGLGEFGGPFVFGTAVANTIGANVVDPRAITVVVVIAALAAASLWNVLTWWLSIPTSSSHALVGGLVGAVVTSSGFNLGLLQVPGLVKIAGGLFLAPVVSLTLAYIVMSLLQFALRSATPHVNWFFKRGQVITTLGLALSHGANDAPKSMGVITMALVATGLLPVFKVPLWAILLAAGGVALGTVLGGWRLVRTIGTRFYRVRPLDAFNSQTCSGLVVIAASILGSPVSTSQVVSSAIVGTGAADRLTKVRWLVLQEIVLGWLFTIPTTAVLGGLVYYLLSQFMGR